MTAVRRAALVGSVEFMSILLSQNGDARDDSDSHAVGTASAVATPESTGQDAPPLELDDPNGRADRQFTSFQPHTIRTDLRQRLACGRFVSIARSDLLGRH